MVSTSCLDLLAGFGTSLGERVTSCLTLKLV